MRLRGRALLMVTFVAAGASQLAPTAQAGVHTSDTAYRVSLEPSVAAMHVGVGDFNGDRHLDLAAAAVSSSGGDVTVAVDVGYGFFRSVGVWDVDPRPGSIATADFNRDGASDILVPSGTLAGATVLYGDPSAAGSSPTLFDSSLGLGSPTSSVAVGDFKGDGLPDAVASSPDTAFLLPGAGGGGFGAPSLYGMGSDQHGPVESGDFNGDARDDLVAVQQPGGATVAVRLSDADGELLPPVVTALPACCASGIAVGRFNADQRSDLVLSYASSAPTVLIAGADGTFGVSTTLPLIGASAPPAVGDMNADGKADLIFSDAGGLTVLTGHGDGTFGAVIPVPAPAQRVVQVALDANRDGFSDLVLAESPVASVVVALNTPWVATNADALSFGTLAAGATSRAQTLTVTNDGQPPLAIGSFWLEGPHKGDFAVVSESCTGRALPADDTCGFAIASTPSASGNRSAELVIASNSGAGHRRVALRATGLPDRDPPVMKLVVKRRRLGALIKRGLAIKVTCSEACEMAAKLLLKRAPARRLKLPRAVARAESELARAGSRKVRLRLRKRAAKAFRPLERTRLTLRVVATDTAGNEATVSRKLKIRR